MPPSTVHIVYKNDSDLASVQDIIFVTAQDNKADIIDKGIDAQRPSLRYITLQFMTLWYAIWFMAQLTPNLSSIYSITATLEGPLAFMERIKG